MRRLKQISYLHSIQVFGALLLGLCLNQAFANSSVRNIQALSDNDFHTPTEQSAKLGQLLFYDKILSGNRNISCASCHHPDHATSDGLSLGIGEGGIGLGPDRRLDDVTIKHLIPRNSPALFNLGAKEFVTLFHDGRLSSDPIEPGGFNSPAEEFLPDGLNSIVAAQALFPITSASEMAGDLHENEVAGAVRRRIDYAWTILSDRVKAIPEYADRIKALNPDVNSTSDISITHIANALGDFIAFEWRADNSPFDHYLNGDKNALDKAQQTGLALFYGKGQCATCHTGALQTDHQFHGLALPQFGPGRTRRFDLKSRDMGRINESDRFEDAYKFRTPSLRNVQHTAPYGHNGAYKTLTGIIRHHTDPIAGLNSWTRAQLVQSNRVKFSDSDFLIMADKQEQLRLAKSSTINPVTLSEEEINALVAFMSALTDKQSLYGRLGTPDDVPSHLSIDP